MTPWEVLTLGVREGLHRQPIPWKYNLKDTPTFRAPVHKITESDSASVEELRYSQYHDWLKRLGKETGFPQVVTTYCLRRATGNAVNGKLNKALYNITKVLRRSYFE